MRTSIRVIYRTFVAAQRPLVILIFMLTILNIFFGSIMWYAERGTYDDTTGMWQRLTGFLCPATCPDDTRKFRLGMSMWSSCTKAGESIEVFSPVRINDTCKEYHEVSPFTSIPYGMVRSQR